MEIESTGGWIAVFAVVIFVLFPIIFAWKRRNKSKDNL